jgi:hypothetical protein
LLPQTDCREAASFQGIEIASNSGGVTHTRLDAVSRKTCRYIMRDSIGKSIWQGVDVDEYLRRERSSWSG